VLTTFSFHPIPPDSAKAAAEEPSGTLFPYKLYPQRARVLDAGGSPMPEPAIAFRLSDTTIAYPTSPFSDSPVSIYGRRPGNVTIYAEMTAFGVSKEDTLPFRVGYPLSAQINIVPVQDGALAYRLLPTEVTIATGGYVFFFSDKATNETDITFTDPTHVGPFADATYNPLRDAYCGYMQFVLSLDCAAGGNFVVPALPTGADFTFNARTFQAPGTYEFHSALRGYSGRIIVVDER